MKYYLDIDYMWMDALRLVYDEGRRRSSRNGDVRRVFGWCGILEASEQRTLLLNPRRAIDPAYAAAETLWYLGRRSDVGYLIPYAPSYARFAEPNGDAFGAYGGRIRQSYLTIDQIGGVLNALRRSSESRQAVIALWDPRDLTHAVRRDKKDLPCTLTWQFSVDCAGLDMMTTMRSNDLWLGMPYDVFAFTCLQRLIADELQLQVGRYIHCVGDLHLYEKNAQAASECIPAWAGMLEYGKRPSHGWSKPSYQDDCKIAVEVAADAATSAEMYDDCGCMLRDLSRACINKRQGLVDGYVSPLFRDVEKNHADRRGCRPGRQDDAVQQADPALE